MVDTRVMSRRSLRVQTARSTLLLLCGLLLGAVAGAPVRAALEQAAHVMAPAHAAASLRWSDTAALADEAGPVSPDRQSTGERVARYVALVLAPRVRVLE